MLINQTRFYGHVTCTRPEGDARGLRAKPEGRGSCCLTIEPSGRFINNAPINCMPHYPTCSIGWGNSKDITANVSVNSFPA